MERLFLTRENIKQILDKSEGNLSILSGGEPFEHPEIHYILTDLNEQTHPFRIATGGFIDLLPWIEQLRILSRQGGPLKGISMGTDVLSSRVSHSKWVPVWENNIRNFSKFQIPYSLTLTIEGELDFARLNLWKWTEIFDGIPEFIYLRYTEKSLIEDWICKIHGSFGAIPIIHDDIGSMIE